MNNENLTDLDLKISYKTTDADDPINEFYIPCLNHSEEFFRSVGYFRSSIFLITVLRYFKASLRIMPHISIMHQLR